MNNEELEKKLITVSELEDKLHRFTFNEHGVTRSRLDNSFSITYTWEESINDLKYFDKLYDYNVRRGVING